MLWECGERTACPGSVQDVLSFQVRRRGGTSGEEGQGLRSSPVGSLAGVGGPWGRESQCRVMFVMFVLDTGTGEARLA